MGTTPIKALPYPEPTAPVANGAADIKALAEKLDTLLAATQPLTPPWYVATGGNDAVPTGVATLTWPNLAGDAFNYDPPNKRFICQSAGQYALSARAWGSTGSVVDIRLLIGPLGMTHVVPTAGGMGTVAVVQTLNVGDTVAVQMNNTGAATTTVAGSTRFEGTRIKA